MSSSIPKNAEWSESVAVGSRKFVDQIKEKLRSRAIGREQHKGQDAGTAILREPSAAYNADFYPQNSVLSHENALIWKGIC